MWVVTVTKQAAKELGRLPKRVVLIYAVLVEELASQGPRPQGWDVKALENRPEIRIRLNREYRVLLVVLRPNILVVRIAHRKEVYE